ncbi:MAG: ABC transporter ATP-binding protein [Sphingomonadaceae bacterium]
MLKIEKLHVRYGGVHALKGISLEVPEGKIVSLLGANGAGKSSTLRTIAGLVKPVEGRVIFDGGDITGMQASARVRAGIAMVPEGRHAFTNLTVLDNLLMGAYARRDEAGVKRDMERVFTLFPRLRDRRTQRAGTLSGGEQQMLVVGRALMSAPRLLLMDEPSLGLAPNLVAELFDTIDQIHLEGITILLVEQNARAALRIADHGYVMELGEIVLQGSGAELLRDDRVRKAYLGVE